MKKKTATNVSININDGVETKSYPVKHKSEMPTPFDTQFVYYSCMATHMKNSVGMLRGMISKHKPEDKIVRTDFFQNVLALAKATDEAHKLATLKILARVYKLYPELEGFAIGFNKGWSMMKLRTPDCKDEVSISTLKGVLVHQRELEEKNGVSEELGEAMEEVKNSSAVKNLSTEEQIDLAKKMAKLSKLKKALKGETPMLTSKELNDTEKDVKEMTEDLLKNMVENGEGGLA